MLATRKPPAEGNGSLVGTEGHGIGIVDIATVPAKKSRPSRPYAALEESLNAVNVKLVVSATKDATKSTRMTLQMARGT